MKRYSYLTIAVLIGIAIHSGCQDKEFEDNFENRFKTYNVSVEAMGSATKTQLVDGYRFGWSAGDIIQIYDGTDIGKCYKLLDGYDREQNGKFRELTSEEEYGLTEEGYIASGNGNTFDGIIATYPFYEYSRSIEKIDDSTFKVDFYFPWIQEHRYEGDYKLPMIALGSNDSSTLSFKNLGGLLRLSLKGECSISTIRLKGNSPAFLSGTGRAYINDNVTVQMDTFQEGALSTDITLECHDTYLSPDYETTFLIAVPPTEFETGFTITITDSNGNIYTKKTDKRQVIGRSQILSMPCLYVDESEGISTDLAQLQYMIENLKSYDSSTGKVVIGYSEDNFPLEGQAFILPPDYGSGIRVIEDIQETDDQELTLKTSEGNLCNLYKDSNFTLTTSPEVATRSYLNGPVYTPSEIGYIDENGEYHEIYSRNAATRANYPVEIWNWELEEDFGGDINDYLSFDIFKINASIDMTMDFNFGSKTIWKVRKIGDIKQFKFEVSGDLDLDLLLGASVEGSFKEEEDKLIETDVIKQVVINFPTPGGAKLPIYIRTHLGKCIEFNSEGEISAGAGFNFNANMKTGMTWSPYGGAEEFQEVTTELSEPELKLDIKASMEAKVSYYPHIEFKLCNISGPYIEPRPYIHATLNAGAGITSGEDSYIGWDAEINSGLDLNLGLSVLCFGLDQLPQTGPFNVTETTIMTAPERVRVVAPEENVLVIEEDEYLEVEVIAESFSPITGEYYPCPMALINFDTEFGETDPEVAVCDINGIALSSWYPEFVDDKKELTLMAQILDSSGEVVDETGITVKHPDTEQWVDLGLSVEWAKWNIGALSPEEEGTKFQWGETGYEERYWYNQAFYVGMGWYEIEYVHHPYPHYSDEDCVSEGELIMVYIDMGEDISYTEYDAVCKHWSEGRMPTKKEFQELIDSCQWTVTNYNGIPVFEVTGPNKNSIYINSKLWSSITENEPFVLDVPVTYDAPSRFLSDCTKVHGYDPHYHYRLSPNLKGKSLTKTDWAWAFSNGELVRTGKDTSLPIRAVRERPSN